MAQTTSIGILGGGAWGTALAVLANRAGSDAIIWTRNENVRESIEKSRVNKAYLPDAFIDPDVVVTDDIAQVAKSDALLIVIPAQSVRAKAIELSDLIPETTPLVLCSKGVERGSLMLMHEVVQGILPHNPLAVLSGPNFAKEAAAGMPSAATIASESPVLADKLSFAIGGVYFRTYFTDDLAGTEVGGAVKNVIAIAAGVCAGRGLGENARAALITRGLAEMVRLAEVKGGRAETLYGLAGVGDLLLTCSSLQSRNTAFGVKLAQAGSMAVMENAPGTLAEGVFTAESIHQLAQRQGVHMPICSTVYHLLQGNIAVDEAIERLLSRPFTSE